ncbi:MAG: Ppx/GppA family phosphatase [Pseudomonadota bacterium]
MTRLDMKSELALTAVPTMPLVGVIDIGSNSIRLVIFEDGVRSPDYFFNEKTICELGRDLGSTGKLHPVGKTSALRTLRRFTSLALRMGVSEILAVGTAALREAEDGPAFREEIEALTGLNIRIASGQEEATLTAAGVLFGWPAAEGVVADLGGSSLELAEIHDGGIGQAVSTPAGHLRLAEEDQAEPALSALRNTAQAFTGGHDRLILVGGAWRALAKAHMTQKSYPFHVLQGYEMTVDEVRELTSWAVETDPAQLKAAADVSSTRLRSLAAGARALRSLIDVLEPRRVAVSSFGVREGLVFERMANALREEEPLIAAARRAETRNARCPGFGEELFAWMTSILDGFTQDWLRLAHATCLLHDVSWRTHPDYRAAACFGHVSRANLGGVGHNGRLFMGAALVHRYKGSIDSEGRDALSRLPKDTRAAAEVVGRAARLGAMLSGSIIGTLSGCRLSRTEDRLVLTFSPASSDFAGERVERRLNALASAMGLEPQMVV